MEVKILPSSLHKGTLEIHLDGTLWKKVSRKYFRKELKTLSKESFIEDFAELEKKKASLCGLDLLAARAYTKKKLVQALQRRHFSEEAIAFAFSKILEKYIDDEALARSKIRIFQRQGKGERLILQKLKEYVDISQGELKQMIEEEAPIELRLEKIQALLKTKYRPLDRENRPKAIRFLISRGYSYDLIQRALELD